MNQPDIKKLIQEVLEEGYLISLGTIHDCKPWVCDLIYLHDELGNIYWISLPDARHSKAVEECKYVSGTIVANFEPDSEKAIQISGTVQKIDEPLFDFEKRLQEKRGKPIPTVSGEVLSKGHVWYKLIPEFIELHYTKHFGYEKQKIEF